MDSFQATTGWESPRNCENKIIVPIISFPIRYKKFQKIAKKFKKLRNRILALFKPKQVGKAQERVKIKIIVPICFYPTRYKKFQKKIAKKIQQIKEHDSSFFSSKNRLEKPEKK